jgi:pyruvate kinase
MGKFPEEAVMMLARIAAFTETHRVRGASAARREVWRKQSEPTASDRMASIVEHALDTVPCEVVLVPTRGGSTARIISSFKPSVWVVAPTGDPAVAQGLAFSYGVHPVNLADEPEDWREFVERWLPERGVKAERVLLVAGPSQRNPNANHRIELMRLSAS